MRVHKKVGDVLEIAKLAIYYYDHDISSGSKSFIVLTNKFEDANRTCYFTRFYYEKDFRDIKNTKAFTLFARSIRGIHSNLPKAVNLE